MRQICLKPRGNPSQLLALSIAVEHPGCSTDPQVLCAAAQTCTILRDAVRQHSACNLVIVLRPDAPLPQLRSFASWLPHHKHLVSSITTNVEKYCGLADKRRAFDSHVNVCTAQLLLEEALQPAAQSPAAAAAAAAGLRASDAGRTTTQQQQQQQQRLGLTSFSSNYATLAVLKSLPAQSLTHLQFNLAGALPEEYPATGDVLASFSNLEQLQLADSSWCQKPTALGSCLLGIMQLSKLTQLRLDSCAEWELQEPLQQLLAHPPPLRQLQLLLSHPHSLDMTAITQLEEFTTDVLLPDSVLPRQLQRVKLTLVHLDGSLRPLFALQQLQRLDVCIAVDLDGTDTVLRLATQLTALTHLALTYTYARDAASAAPAWCKLPQLRELSLDYEEEGVRVYSWHINSILAGVAAATSLTKLVLEAFCALDETEEDEQSFEEYDCADVAACSSLSSLTGLRDLCITEYSTLAPGDALALTALTQLTRLVLNNMRHGVGDVAAAGIVLHLTLLRHLDLRCCELGSAGGDLAGIEGLVHLTELRLEGNAQLSGKVLTQLPVPPCLVELGLDSQQVVLVDDWASVTTTAEQPPACSSV